MSGITLQKKSLQTNRRKITQENLGMPALKCMKLQIGTIVVPNDIIY